jgi:ATP-dependent RNA helicase DHX37/DHR1
LRILQLLASCDTIPAPKALYARALAFAAGQNPDIWLQRVHRAPHQPKCCRSNLCRWPLCVQVLQALSQHQLDAKGLQLLRPVSSRGQKETKRQALKRALQLERAGIQVPAEARLLQERPSRGADSGSSSGSDSEGEEEEEEGEEGEEEERRAAAGLGRAATGSMPPARSDGGSSSSSSTGESGSEGEEDSEVEDAGQALPVAKKPRLTGAAASRAGHAAAAAPAGAGAGATAGAGQLAEQRRRQKQAAEAIKHELGVRPAGVEEEEDAAAARRRGQQGMGAAGGQARVVMVQRRPEIEAVRCAQPGGG